MSRAASQASRWAALAALLLVACDTPDISTDEVAGVSYVHERRRAAADVTRATEAYSTKEDHGADVVFHTDPSVRPGHYFYVKLAEPLPPGGRLVLEVVRVEGRPPERHEFTPSLRPGFPFGEYVIGLTGAQAGEGKWRPVAWRFSAVDARGKVLAAKHSFLWGTPADLSAR